MSICRAIGVSPEWLLSGVESRRGNDRDYYTIAKSSNMGRLITLYLKIKPVFQGQVIGYMEALSDIEENETYGAYRGSSVSPVER